MSSAELAGQHVLSLNLEMLLKGIASEILACVRKTEKIEAIVSKLLAADEGKSEVNIWDLQNLDILKQVLAELSSLTDRVADTTSQMGISVDQGILDDVKLGQLKHRFIIVSGLNAATR
jgi:hypothetical protein